MTLEAAPPRSTPEKRTPPPVTEGQRPPGAMFLVGVFVILPTLALFTAVPLAWGWGLGWVDVALFAVFYLISGLGVTVGFHRYFTHGSFKAKRPLRIALAVAGSIALQGSVLDWVGDHRRHHAFSDKEGDPHSPWLYGTGAKALVKGFWHSHMGWLFDRDLTNMKRFAPDLLEDKDMMRVGRAFPLIVVISLLGPALIGGLVTMSWWGAFTAFFWAGLVRVAVLHHVTWSINSICHIWGERPFASRDKSANVWWLAVLSFGESWHNLHHADPTCARHGVKKGQIDISALVIRGFEKLGWATNVRWPTTRRLEKLSAKKQAAAAA
ncbi:MULTISPECIES: acyl-CoA desaturase [unclassified Pseudonocardia]|uniref:acyl-CoA desaturase n=1 Tax=unclassified Pseudonocardia TaxID=2619320 RepID=UPI000314D82B|nr:MULTISPECIES: acyl-CoA desaturase [unclassified Pseudonocardia]ALE72368.1 stearoyl-CoA 9-desaturase [Pseudonocardia sp. EC080625-04]ALL75661.1 stearoyl-CoA 9-desaturase [Pseudonocardia sp. EC080610-09]ALL82689.1 stearoyl-CoA 9-desaturase [Pseudonocardia sp. EC080619-01]OLM20471.1 Fatty acid desaturase, Delta-9 fatty acid desaturase [Pseudonocardia sp. Ae707_Ps1]